MAEPYLRRLVERALEEDGAWADVTTSHLGFEGLEVTAAVVAKAQGVLAGMETFSLAFQVRDEAVRVRALSKEGERVSPGQQVALVQGPGGSILSAERVALNFLQRLSGVASLAALYVAAIEGTGARILDTRKTTPGLRVLEKRAVRLGGAINHRLNLSDGVLIKDNHLVLIKTLGRGLADAVAAARSSAPPTVKIEVEAQNLEQAREAIASGADVVMLDNMSLAEMREAVALGRGKVAFEASGGVTLENVRAVAETGVDYISVGAITHSAPALDFSLEILEVRRV